MSLPHALHGEGEQPQAGGGVSPVRRARQLRREVSLPEVLLWQRRRGRSGAFKFRRQHPLGPYVLDFYCAAAGLAVEVDGEVHSHPEQASRDSRRDAYLESAGVRVVRPAARDVLADVDRAADALMRVAIAAKPLHRPAGGPPPQASLGEDCRGAA